MSLSEELQVTIYFKNQNAQKQIQAETKTVSRYMIQHAFVRVSEIFALQQYSSAPIYQKIWQKVNEFQEKGINSLDKFQYIHLEVSSVSFVLFCAFVITIALRC